MIIITGAAGFIGSNIVHELNSHGISSLLLVDSSEKIDSTENLRGARFEGYMGKGEFRRAITENSLHVGRIEAILHQGACTDTGERDRKFLMDNNYQFTKEIFAFAVRQQASFIFASSAAVYGNSRQGRFIPDKANEYPLNLYGRSKLAFDEYFRRWVDQGRVPITAIGLRYFNVYGPREKHKGSMASMVWQCREQIKRAGRVRLFAGCGPYGNGEQRRDFIYVNDIVRLNLFFANLGPFARSPQVQSPKRCGLVNAGSGSSRSFNEVAGALMEMHGEVPIEYFPLPRSLRTKYQYFTEANLMGLRNFGFDCRMTALEEGIRAMEAVLRSIGD